MGLQCPDDLPHRRAVLRGLAANAAAPEEVALRLIRQPDLAEDVALHRRDVSERIADAILSLDNVRAAECLGHNGWSPPDVLVRLAGQPEPTVRAAAARNKVPEYVGPGCEVPTWLLRRLAEDIDPIVRERVASHSQLPDDARTHLAVDADPRVRKAVAEHWFDAPPDTVRRWIVDDDADVRVAALRKRRWMPPPRDLHAQLLLDPATRADVVRHVDLTPELIAELAESPDELVRAALACHPDLPVSAVHLLAGDQESMVRINVLTNRNTPEEIRAQLHAELTGGDHDEADRFLIPFFLYNAWKDSGAVRWLRDAPLAERLQYLDSPYPVFRTILATSTDLPPWAVGRLMRDEKPLVRRIVALSYDAVPGDLLEQLVRDHGENVGFRPLVSELPNFPADAFVRFANSGDSELRAVACQFPDLPEDAVAAIAADPSPYTRRAAAAHPHLPTRSLRDLLVDEDRQVVEAAAAAPLLPVPWMYAILDQAAL